MVLPVNVATCTVTGAFVNLAGTPASGTVTFTPCPARILDATATPPTTILGTPIVATVTAGTFTVNLPATDDTDLNPTDWAYHVAVRLGGDAAYRFCMYAPEGAVDLAEVTPIIGTTGDAILAGPPGEDGPPGPGVPTGGTAGEILAKVSGTDFDTDWVPASAPGVHASTHSAGSTDPVTITEAQVTGLVADLAAKQPLDADLTAIAALAPSSDAVIQRKVGMWVASTPTEYKTDLALTKSDVGLSNVTNTSDANKPVSTAQQTALDLKANKSTTITPTAPLTGGGDLSANRTLAVSLFTTSASGVVPASSGTSTDFLRADGTWAAPAGGGGGGISGITVAAAGTPLDTDITALDFAVGFDLTESPENEVNIALNMFDTDEAGIVPASGGGTADFLRADGTWAQPSGVAGVSNTLTYSYNTTTSEPPTGNQLRLNSTTFSAATRLWVAVITVDGLDASIGLARILAGHQIYFQDRDDASHWVKYNVTADGVDDGTYYDFAVTYHSGPGAIPAGQIEFQLITPGTVGVPPGGTTGQVLAKDSGADYDVEWASVASASDLTTHAADTTSVHGITDTSVLETTTGSQAKVDTHVNDTTAAHAATAISYAGSTNLVATTVEAALDELDTEKQPLDTDLTTIAGLTATTDNFMVSVSSAWASRTPTQAKATLALDNVTNTSDANKPVSTATQTALDLKQDKSQTINAQTGTTYTLVLTDAGKIVTLSNAAAITLTVPTNASVAFPIGTSIDLIQLAAGQFTVTGAGPPTISKSMATAKSRTQYSVLTLIKTATDVWILTGDAAAS